MSTIIPEQTTETTVDAFMSFGASVQLRAVHSARFDTVSLLGTVAGREVFSVMLDDDQAKELVVALTEAVTR